MTSIFLTMAGRSQKSAKELQEIRSSERDYKRITVKTFSNKIGRTDKGKNKMRFFTPKRIKKDDKFDGTRGDGTGGAFSITILSH